MADTYWNCKCGASYKNHKPTDCTCGRTEPMWPSEKQAGDYVVVRMEW